MRAWLLGLRASRVRARLEGYERGGTRDLSVAREAPTGSDIVYELVIAGESVEDVAAGYEMTVEDVRAACAFEETAYSYAA